MACRVVTGDWCNFRMGKNKKDGQPMRPWQSGSNHQGQRIQLWDINNMKQALQYYFTVNSPEYDRPCFGYKAIADMYDLPRETFRRHTTGELKGYYGHLLGGKDTPQNPLLR